MLIRRHFRKWRTKCIASFSRKNNATYFDRYLYCSCVVCNYVNIDSLLVLASSAISRDFYQQIFKPNKTEKELAKISKIITLILAIFALIIAMIVAVAIPGRTIFCL